MPSAPVLDYCQSRSASCQRLVLVLRSIVLFADLDMRPVILLLILFSMGELALGLSNMSVCTSAIIPELGLLTNTGTAAFRVQQRP